MLPKHKRVLVSLGLKEETPIEAVVARLADEILRLRSERREESVTGRPTEQQRRNVDTGRPKSGY